MATFTQDFINLKELIVGFLNGNSKGLGLTADSGSIQGGQVLVSSFNVIDTSGTAGDAVTMPAIYPAGQVIFIKNGAGANAIDVFPSLNDNIGAGANTAVSLAAGAGICYIATTGSAVIADVGVWEPLIP